MRLDIHYRMRFRYDEAVREAHNELRVRPRDLPEQRLLAHRLTSSPLARVLSFTDYWGTTVDHLGVIFEHEEFEIVAEAAVETRERGEHRSAPISVLKDEAFRQASAEFLTPSPHVEWDDEIVSLARDATQGANDVATAVASVVTATREVLGYERDSTHIGISLGELMSGRKGVCQDFAHLSIGLLRAAGIPARYVSGYLFASDETNLETGPSETVVVQTHAWIEAGLPNGTWIAADPTNDQPVGERHVVIGFGRDYDDVAPVRGVYSGAGIPKVEATVEMQRMEPVERTMTARPRRRTQPSTFAVARPAVDAEQQQQQQQ